MGISREREDWRGLLPQAGPYAGVGPANYDVPDARLFELVCEALADHADVDASRVHVRVSHHVVSLDGDIADAQQEKLAIACAERVRGVREVHSHLRLAH